MTRQEFLNLSAILGIGIPLQATLQGCGKEIETSSFSGKVIIIGAGAGGLSAAYLLQQQGIEFEIVEASSNYGGRIRIDNNFADFPIPLGAEWIETNAAIFSEIVNNKNINIDIKTISDDPELKFVNYSWFNFFEDYIVPSISNKISYNTVAQSIDYSNKQIFINTNKGQYTADKVIVSVPLKILQDGDISFIPNLPEDKQNAINKATIWGGFKAFIEFSEKFYTQEIIFDIPKNLGKKVYYNAALGQNTTKNIFGLFAVGTPAANYLPLQGNELKDFILNELDQFYNNQASPNFIKIITQNWNNEPFIKAAYLSDEEDWQTVKKLGESVLDKIYFAGSEYTDGENWVSVHTAAQAAKTAVDKIIR